jgi:hypothetical protein
LTQSCGCITQVYTVNSLHEKREGRGEGERERGGKKERKKGPPKLMNALTSGSPVTNPKSGPDYSVFMTKYILHFQFYLTRKMFFASSLKSAEVRIPQVEDHCIRIL